MERAVRVLRSPVFVIAAVTLLAGFLRFNHLTEPRSLVFDETYYAKDACIYLGEPAKDCGLTMPSEQSWVHPPLGKWLIAGGEALFGADIEGPDASPFGWRFSSAMAGTITVALLSMLALVLTGSALWAGVAGLLLATENLSFVQSRMSMLDIFIGMFVVAGFLLMALDRRWIARREPPTEPDTVDLAGFEDEAEDEEPGTFAARQSWGPGAMAAGELDVAARGAGGAPRWVPSPVFRWWRIGAGAMFGAAAAVEVGRPDRTARGGPARLGVGGHPPPARRTAAPDPRGDLPGVVRAADRVRPRAPPRVPVDVPVWLSDHQWSLNELLKHHASSLRVPLAPRGVQGERRPHPPLPVAGVEVDPDAPAGLVLLRERRGNGRGGDPGDGQPGDLLGKRSSRSRTSCGAGSGGGSGRAGWSRWRS